MIKQIKTAFILLLLLTILTGIIYPLMVTGVAQLLFPWKANGSLIERDGKVIGSVLIGQSFTDPAYFWGRPSATIPFPYNAAASSGSNMGPSNPDFLSTIKLRVAAFQKWDSQHFVPVDLVTASGSGLDSEISPEAAFYQVPRIAKLRHLSEAEVRVLVQSVLKERSFYFLGEPRVNVLQLNLALGSPHATS
ncbi:MAG: potassium-transporting ATPase subunit KdpC [Gammaproteobacteria bacterium]|nr:MAG: potassium-transporting ATPase subunit KdpC [Gammaproteobacteria bacterium]